MRYLILSDIHGNHEALAAIQRDGGAGYGGVICCGDLVGYGADPNAVVDWVRERATAVVRGNHDKACAGLDDLEWFNPVARQAALWTENSLTPENLTYLRMLPKGPVVFDEFQLIHGSPLDEDEYLVSSFAVQQVAAYLERPVSFFGHTHIQGGFACFRNGVQRLSKPEHGEARRTIQLEDGAYYLINPGSVGQPRDGDPRAAYAVYDSDDRTVEFRRVAYNVRQAQAKIREAGLPGMLADRLESGT